MSRNINLFTRREFLRTTVLTGALSATVPSFLSKSFSLVQAAGGGTAAEGAPILVIIQMAGGNDGLNTLVPHTNDEYAKVRPTVKLDPATLLKINDDLGLHPALRGLKALHDEGELAIVQGVGYPNPNRSHFRSTEIWQTASDSTTFEKHGWLGRYFDNECEGNDPVTGINIGGQTPQAFANATGKSVSFVSPNAFQ